MDLLLTDYDMDLTNGDLSFVNGADAIGQDVTMRLRTWLGETVYDGNDEIVNGLMGKIKELGLL